MTGNTPYRTSGDTSVLGLELSPEVAKELMFVEGFAPYADSAVHLGTVALQNPQTDPEKARKIIDDMRKGCRLMMEYRGELGNVIKPGTLEHIAEDLWYHNQWAWENDRSKLVPFDDIWPYFEEFIHKKADYAEVS